MAQVKYVYGETVQFGYVFEDGKAVDVTDAKHLAKFEGNAFFEVLAAEEPAPAAVVPVGPFVAVEKSAGWWAITDKDGAFVGKSFRENDAVAFNSMTDEEKAAYVASQAE